LLGRHGHPLQEPLGSQLSIPFPLGERVARENDRPEPLQRESGPQLRPPPAPRQTTPLRQPAAGLEQLVGLLPQRPHEPAHLQSGPPPCARHPGPVWT